MRTSVGKVIAVAAPSRVRARLAAARGPVEVLHRGPLALYLGVDGWCVGVVGTTAAAVPCALRLAGGGTGELGRARSAHVAGGVLHVDGVPLLVGRTVDVRVPRIAPPVGWTLSDTDLSDVTTELPHRALHRLASGDPAAVPALIGRGSGLTPSGDDVLCGWLAVHHAAEVDVPELAREIVASLPRTTTLSATLLDCALHGEVLPEFARLLRALDDPSRLGQAVDAVARIGHTSGRALLLGAHLALSSLVSTSSSHSRTERSRCA